jgi:chromate reductase
MPPKLGASGPGVLNKPDTADVTISVDGVHLGLLLGSLNEGSTNELALQVVAARTREAGGEATMVIGLEEVPPFVPSRSDDPPAPVVTFRGQLAASDMVVVAAPEYAAGLAGTVKNALDWLVGAATLYQRVVGVISAGTTGGAHAIEQLVWTLTWQGAYVVAALGLDAPRTRMVPDGSHYDEPTTAAIAAFTDAVIRAGTGAPDDRRRAVTEVVSRYGIDVGRFGEFR